MSCWEQRKLLYNRIAKVVDATTPGASNALTENAILTLPSPRLQALVSVLIPPSDVAGNPDVLWMDASNAATLSVNPATWQIFPLPEHAAEVLTAKATPGRLATYWFGEGILSNEANGGGFAYMADYHSANRTRYMPTYEISGETIRNWLITANLYTFNDPAAPVYATMQAEITPAPGISMSPAEWAYWSNLCKLQSLTSSSAAPRLLKKANG